MDKDRQTILVVDDQASICYALNRFLGKEGYLVRTAINGAAALVMIQEKEPNLLIMDVRMPGLDGLEVLRLVKEGHPKVEVIMMTAYSTTDQAIEAIKFGAFDYLIKPFDNVELLERIKDALRNQRLNENVVLSGFSQGSEDGEQFIGKASGIVTVFKQIGKIAPTDVPVLIQGETGTGKELVARAIFQHSNRSGKRFMVVNCAAIPEQLLESELFGYERGAFTGADARRIGKVEQCRDGTLFLDEIGELPANIQAKLLRVIQDGTFQRLGGNETIQADFRLLAATNKDLRRLVADRYFREDLFYRINTVTIQLPPLRDRREDIPLLADYFIKRYREMLGKKINGLTEKTVAAFMRYSWPGNVRELKNIIHKAVIFSNAPYLCVDCCIDLPATGLQPGHTTLDAIAYLVETAFAENAEPKLHSLLGCLEKAMIEKAMKLANENQVKASEMLGISRNTLRKHHIIPPSK